MALGAAYITVHADTAPFAKEVQRQVRDILRATEKSVRGDSDRIGQGISDGISDGVRRNSKKVRDSVTDSLSKDTDGNFLRRSFSKLGATASSFFVGGFTKAFGAGGNALASGLETSVKGMGNLFGSIFNVTVTSVGAASALVAVFLFASTVVLPGLISLVIALTAALSNLLGLLAVIPSAFGVLIAIILPLVAAFQGFGEAIGAVLSKDPKKIAEAMKGLTPAARSVIKELQGLMPLFSKLGDIAQEAFFKPLVGDLTALIQRASGPMLHGFGIVARAAGELVSSVLAALSRPEMVIFFQDMFAGAAQALTTLKEPITNLILAFAAMAQAAMPTFQALIDSLGGFLTRFSEWITANIADGSFQAFLDKAVLTLKDVKDLIGAVIELFKVMFAGTEAGGRTFLQAVTAAVQKLTAFFESERGQRALQAMIDLAIIFGLGLLSLVYIAGYLAGRLEAVASVLRTIIRLISGIDIRKFRVEGPIGRGGALTPFASGGIVTQPTLAMIGEGGASEVVIPLNDANRAQQLADQSGLSSMLRGDSGNITLIAYIGGQQVEAFVERKIEGAFSDQSRALAYGARAGV